MADAEVTGTLTSGGALRATPYLVEVSYPGGERAPVTIDLGEVTGVARSGAEVTLTRRDGRQVGLKTSALEEAGRLEALVRSVVALRREAEFQRAIARLHADGYRVMAATPTLAQLVRPKRFNYWLAAILLLLAVFPAVLYVFYFFSQPDEALLVAITDDGRVVTYE